MKRDIKSNGEYFSLSLKKNFSFDPTLKKRGKRTNSTRELKFSELHKYVAYNWAMFSSLLELISFQRKPLK